MNEAQDMRTENRIVSDWLLYYHERLGLHRERQSKVSYYQSPQAGDGIRAQGRVSDPTAQRAIKLAEIDTRWFDLIAEVEMMLPEKQRVFLDVRREALHLRDGRRGKPAWVAYVQCKYPLVMSQKTGRPIECYYVSTPSVLFDWWNKIVDYTARLAIRKGVL